MKKPRFRFKYKSDCYGCRLLERVTRAGDCWIFTGPKGNDFGHRMFSYNGRMVWAHRAAMELLGGINPKGEQVCHRCDNPACINPAHLFLGSQKDNAQDMMLKGRSTHGSKHWRAKLTEAKVAEIKRLFGKLEHSEIAAKYGVARSTISNIATGHRWRRVSG